MSFIPVLCHNFLHNSLKRRNQNNSNCVSSNNHLHTEKTYSTDNTISFEDFINMYNQPIGSRNNSRGGSRL